MSIVVTLIYLKVDSLYWKDLLTNYNGTAINYDAIGNPSNWRDGMTFSWVNGRQLHVVKKNNSVIGRYTYDSDGMRITKTTAEGPTTYHVMNGVCYGETRSDGRNLQYVFDENGRVIGFRMQFDTGSARFYFVFNAQGDVVQLLDSWGNVRANYSYDTWGRCTATDSNGNALSSDSIGMINPFRYRGYYYDNETGLYYASSRYYDPEVCRFISPDTADVLTATPMALTDKNLFAYCDNNPVMREDKDGKFWVQLGATLVGGLISAGMELGSQLLCGKKLNEVNWSSVFIEGVSGAATGLLMSVGIPASAVTAGRAAINAATSVAHSIDEGDRLSQTIIEATTSATITMVTGNAKTLGNRLTQGNHTQLGKIGNLVRSVTYEPRHAKPDYMRATIRNRVVRGTGRTFNRSRQTYCYY